MEIFKLVGRIMVDSAEAEKSLQKTEKEADKTTSKFHNAVKAAAKFGSGTAKVGKALGKVAKTSFKVGAGIAAAATAAASAMVVAAKSTASSMDVIDKGAQRMGVSAEKYQELAYAAGLCGVEMGVLEDAAKTLKSKKLDISVDEALAQLMSIGDESTRDAAALEMFGEAAYKLKPLLNAGTDGMDAMCQEAHDLGLVMSDEAVAAGAAMNDSFSKVGQILEATKNSIMVGLMPYIQEFLDFIIENMPMIQSTISGVVDVLMPVIQSILTYVMENMPQLLALIQGVMESIMPIIQPVVDSVLEILPPVLEAIMAVINAVVPAVEPMVSAVSGLINGLLSLLTGDIEGFGEGIKTFFAGMISTFTTLGSNIFGGLWDGMQSVWGSISSWISGVVNSITDWFSGIGAKIASFFGFDGGGDTDGSHASGLASVPYDGYRATLHRGETVLNPNDTAKLVELLQKGGGGGDDRPIQITTQIVLDGRIIGQSVTKYQRRKERTAGA